MAGSYSLQSPGSKDKESLLSSDLGFEDLSLSFADSFLNFEYIRDWIEKNPESDKSMTSDLRGSPLPLSSEMAEHEMFDGRPDMGSTGFADQTRNEQELVAEESENLGPLGPSGQEKVEFVGIEKGCQSSEKFQVEDGVELINSGCLDEEGVGKGGLDGGMNDLVSALGGMSGLTQYRENSVNVHRNKIVGELIGGCDVEKSVEMGSLKGNSMESGLVIGHGSEGARINEGMVLDDNGKKEENMARHGDEADGGSKSESEAQSSSSSASESTSDSESESESESSSDDDNDEGDVKRKCGDKYVKGKKDDTEMEEGEILSSELEKMVAWSDDEYDEDDGTKVGSMGPPRSKNELAVLPPVPQVNVTLQPHHQILPVGVVSSVIGVQVIVEGVEKHNPLNEGSILWITKSGSPLGVVDEIFGPVKNPYYIVRYNSESEVPSGIQPGSSVSFVPEFANHVLNDKNLYQKGYDASGANDEEISDDEEFSDDEKEAEYRKILKNKKRGKNDEKGGNPRKEEKKFGNRSRNWKCDPKNSTQEPEGTKQHVDPPRQMQQLPNLPLNQGIQSVPPHPGQGLGPPFSQLASSSGFRAFSGGAKGIPFQQPQNVGLPQTPTNGMPLMPPMLPQQLFQIPGDNSFPYQQQINATPNLPSNMILTGCQLGFGSGPAFLPWPACLGQNAFMASPFGMGTPLQQASSLPINVRPQAAASAPGPAALPSIQQAPISVNTGQEVTSNILGTMYNPDSQQQTGFSGKPDTSQSFDQGKQFGGGRKPHHRGGGAGGRFRGGRGRNFFG